MRRRGGVTVWTLVGLILALTGCAPPAANDSIPPRATSLPTSPSQASSEGWWHPAGNPTTVASGLTAPWDHEGDDVWLYTYHGGADDNRVVRMPLSGDPGALTLGDAETVFAGIPRDRTHNGGRIAFGPDGQLYLTTGDAQIRDAAQDPNALGGKILRLTPQGGPAPER